jgi:hypothetical protein
MNRSSAGAEEVARLQRTDLTQSAVLTLTKRTSNSSVLGISLGGGSPTESARGRIWRRGLGREQVALDVVATSGAKPFELSGAADSLSDHAHIECVRQEVDGAHEASVSFGRTRRKSQ